MGIPHDSLEVFNPYISMHVHTCTRTRVRMHMQTSFLPVKV